MQAEGQLGCFSLHGLFLQRQVQVSSTFAHISAEKVLNTRNLWERILAKRTAGGATSLLSVVTQAG